MRNLFIIAFLFPLLAFAQGIDFQFEPEGIPFSMNGWEPYCPWAGGMRNSSPEFVDIDGDEDFDLFCGEWGRISYFNNDGEYNNPKFELVSQSFDSIWLYIYNHPRFVDIDDDLDFDLIIWTGETNEWFYRNIGNSTQYNFLFEIENFLNFLTTAIGGGDFIDIDSDYDFDIIEGDLLGRLHFYINNGNSVSYNYDLISTYFDSIDVGFVAHPTFCDIDADNDYDLFIGNRDGYIYFYRNIGDSVNYDFEFVTDHFAGVDVLYEATPAFCDIDGDSDFDLLVGRESYIWDEGIGDIAFYENIGTAQNCDFVHITDNYISFDVRSWCSPHLVDVDDDGDLDIVTGGEYICYLENIGNNLDPSFQFVTSEFGGYTDFWGASVALGDLDDDGDQDMMLGTETLITYYISWLENIGTPDSTVFRVVTPILISTQDWLFYPSLVDIDADGDLDLLVETEINFVETLQLYENIGTPTRPQFNLTPQTICTFNEMNVYQLTFIDYDDDDDYDLFTPCLYDTNLHSVSYYENVGTPQYPDYELATINFANFAVSNILSNCIDFGDIDGDGDFDLFYGTQLGGIKFYRNQSNPSSPALSITLSYPDVILNWHPIAGAAEYLIYYQDTPYFTPSGIPQVTVNPPVTSWIDTGAVNWGKRFYRVVAGN